MPLWERSFWLSRAFLEASHSLCTSMLAGDFSSQYSSSRVILHLARHGIELFLKAAIDGATQQDSARGHNLSKLLSEYERLYPDNRFRFQLPAQFDINPNRDLFEQDIEADYFHSTLDQRHRYPADRTGQDFATREIFDPTATLREIEELSRSLKILEWVEIMPTLKRAHAP
jgi:hypothetical protein